MTNSTSAATANAERISKALQQLHDIVEPAAPAFWPPAPGWYFLGALLLLLLALSTVHWWRRWQAIAYRRQALAELAALRDGAQSGAPALLRISALASLLRRVALHVTPREKVAALTGAAWLAYLGNQSISPPSPAVAKLLCHGPYTNFMASNESATNHCEDLDSAFVYVAEWIEQHRVSGQHRT